MIDGDTQPPTEEETQQLILTASDPKSTKSLGRQIVKLDGDEWDANCQAIVTQDRLTKLEQNDAMRSYLTGTACKVFVEASPDDHIRGIGVSQSSIRANDPAT